MAVKFLASSYSFWVTTRPKLASIPSTVPFWSAWLTSGSGSGSALAPSAWMPAASTFDWGARMVLPFHSARLTSGLTANGLRSPPSWIASATWSGPSLLAEAIIDLPMSPSITAPSRP